MINKFINSTFKESKRIDKNEIDMNYILWVSKIMNIEYPKTQASVIDWNYLRSREFLS